MELRRKQSSESMQEDLDDLEALEMGRETSSHSVFWRRESFANLVCRSDRQQA